MFNDIKYFVNIYIKEIKEVRMKAKALEFLVDHLYDGIGKEVILENITIIIKCLNSLQVEGSIITDMLKECSDDSNHR